MAIPSLNIGCTPLYSLLHICILFWSGGSGGGGMHSTEYHQNQNQARCCDGGHSQQVL